MLTSIQHSVERVVIPKGTTLYRTSDTAGALDPRPDDETGKFGLYFSTDVYIPLGMIVEWKKPRYLCTCELSADILVPWGKYSFRELEADRFYASMDDYHADEFKLNTYPLQSWNHIDDALYPIIDEFQDHMDLWERTGEAEVFIGEKDLRHVRVVRCALRGITSAKTEIRRKLLALTAADLGAHE